MVIEDFTMHGESPALSFVATLCGLFIAENLANRFFILAKRSAPRKI